ncbi:MAG: MFS transporter [Deltaproteobacteria bacterium]|nr:MAG: MFS transporter [Deltaproteobacteria bacterium]
MAAPRYRWVILILSFLSVLVFAFTLQCLPPILTLLIEELRLTHAEAGSLMSLFALPAILLAILAGMLADRWGPFKTGVISLSFAIIGTLIFAVSGSFLYAGLGRVIAGVGAATITIVAAQVVSQWFRGREVGTAMGIYNTAVPIGTIISFTTFGRLGETLGWRVPLFVTVMVGVIGLAAFLLVYKPAPNASQGISREKEEKVAGIFSNVLKVGVPMWLVGLCWMWFNAAVISFSTFAPDFFVAKGYSIGFAGFLTSLLMWGSLALSPVIGYLVDKFSNHDFFIGAGGVMTATAIYLITQSTDFVFPMLVMAVAVPFIPAPVFSFASKILEPKNLGLGFGILATVSSIGMVFGPYLAGLVRDKTGSYELSFIFLSMLAMLTTITAVMVRIKMRRR